MRRTSNELFDGTKIVGLRIKGMDGRDELRTVEGCMVGYVEGGKVYNTAGKPVDGVSAPEYVARC